ncbi:MAG TPA: winged helix-turn-helix domain-containing protein [Rhizomicrobium sp.]|jgi:adenylate cyclase
MSDTAAHADPLTRVNLAHEPDFAIGQIKVCPARREILGQGWQEILEPRVMRVLVALVRARGEILSREDLIESCWDGVIVGDDAINRCIGRLRKAAEESGNAFAIETVPRVGYRLSRAAGRNPNEHCPAVSAQRLSVCVLPFANMSGDVEQEYFSDGISEDIITDLSKISALSVTARNTAFQFKGKSVDIPQIARQLKVSHVLEGSVRRSGGRVRISAQLIDGLAGDHIWAERYDRDLNDIFVLQDEISEAIVNALKLRLVHEEKTAIERRGTENVEAYNLYLMARQIYARSTEYNAEKVELVIRLCRRATEIDPGYSRAWALMALQQTTLFLVHKSRGACDDGLVAAERALALDPNVAEAHVVRARIYAEGARVGEAAGEIEAALALDADSWEVNRAAGLLSFRHRKLEDATRYWEKATTLMAADIYSPAMLICVYVALKKPEAALRIAQVALSRAEKVLEQDIYSGAALGYGAIALAALGEAQRSKEWINRVLLVDPGNQNARYNCACALSVHLRDTDAALELLGPYFEAASAHQITHAKIDPDLDPLRDDPRLKAMLVIAEARLASKQGS